MGQGVGLQRQSYAIPTMQGGVETIKPYVDEVELPYCKPSKDILLNRPVGRHFIIMLIFALDIRREGKLGTKAPTEYDTALECFSGSNPDVSFKHLLTGVLLLCFH